jgi:hypothetical protein
MLRVVDCVADCVRLAIPQATEWQRIGDEIDAALCLCVVGLRKNALSLSVATFLPGCSLSIANVLEEFANFIGTICDVPLQYASMSGPCLILDSDSEAGWWRGVRVTFDQPIGEKEILLREWINGGETFN